MWIIYFGILRKRDLGAKLHLQAVLLYGITIFYGLVILF